MTQLVSQQLERVRSWVVARFGLELPQDRLGEVGEEVVQLLRRKGHGNLEAGLDWLEQVPTNAGELSGVVQALTVNETYFFRGVEHLHALRDAILPELRAREPRRLSILCAGCASGEEPYTIGMFLREAMTDFADWNVSVLGIDVNRTMIERARKGSYRQWSLRATPEPFQHQYFSARGQEFQIDRARLSEVRFEPRNLAAPDDGFWQSNRFDVVFCRNVLMYFAPEKSQEIVGYFGRSLAEPGWLFLGHAETLRGMTSSFQLCHTGDAFYYRNGADGAVERDPARETLPFELPTTYPTAVSRPPREQRRAAASARVARSDRFIPTHSPSRPAFSAALDLLRAERFTEALAVTRELRLHAEDDIDTLLLLAVLLTNRNEHAEAEQICRQLLALDDLHAGAHYLLALCREQAGDPEAAIDHDRTAIYLDASFAMPHLHLGLLAKRRGDLPLSRRELASALALLEREEEARLLLFGGGFTRAALRQLCRAELTRGARKA